MADRLNPYEIDSELLDTDLVKKNPTPTDGTATPGYYNNVYNGVVYNNSLKPAVAHTSLENEYVMPTVTSTPTTLIRPAGKVFSDRKHISEYDDIVDKYSKEYGVDKKIIHAVMRRETGARTNNQSDSEWLSPTASNQIGGGHVGLMQLSKKYFSNQGDINDPNENLRIGIKNLSELQKRYTKQGVSAEDLPKFILGGYNYGPNRSQFKGTSLDINSLPKETQDYINYYYKLYGQ